MGPRSGAAELKFHCTAANCRRQIRTSFDAFLHPLLKCLICRKCHSEYKTGDFSLFEDGVDDNGDDNYCRWCVDGGDLFTCGNSDQPDPANKCHYSFCTDCIKHNCPDDEVLNSDQLEKDWKWQCYACDPSRLEKQRLAAQEAIINLSQRDLKRTPSGNGASDSTTPARDTEVTSTKTINVDTEELGGSASKKRKTETVTTSDSNKDSGAIQANESAKERDRSKDKAKEKTREKEKEREKDKEREKEKEKDKDSFREPESVNRPPLEPVKPLTSTLRSLKNPVSSIPKPPHGSTPNSSQQQVFITVDKNLSKTPTGPTSKQHPAPSQKSNNIDAKLKSSGVANSNEVPKSRPVTNAVHLHPRLSKQLKSSNETITPTTRVHLTDHDLKTRLDAFSKIKDRCLKEINTKFESIFEMFTSKELENKNIIKNEIEDLQNPLGDFQKMLTSLKSLYSSQRM